MVKDGADLTYYRNGKAAGTHTITQAIPDPQPLFFGGDNEGAEGEMWTGYLDNVRIYDKALNNFEVAGAYWLESASNVDGSSLEYK